MLGGWGGERTSGDGDGHSHFDLVVFTFRFRDIFHTQVAGPVISECSHRAG